MNNNETKIKFNETKIKFNETLELCLGNIKEIILKKGNSRCDKIIFEMPEISLDKIDSVYIGKPGCMCGCNGKYSYLKTSQKSGSEQRGYKVEDNEVNKRSVAFVLNKLKKEASRGIDVIDSRIFYLEINERCYAIYLKK